MAVSRQKKAESLRELKDHLSRAQSVIFANYIGLKVSEISLLRRKLKEANAQMLVAKKTLMRIASAESALPAIEESALPGPVACIFSFSDSVAGAQVAYAFANSHPQVQFLGGYFEKTLLGKDQARALATIPGRATLLTTFAQMLRSPLVSFALMCNSPLTDFARGLSQIAEKKGASSA